MQLYSQVTWVISLLISLQATPDVQAEKELPAGYVIDIFDSRQIGSSELLHSVAVDGAGRVFAVTPEHRAIFWYDGSEWHSIPLSVNPRLVVKDRCGHILLGSSHGASRLRFDESGQIIMEPVSIQFQELEDRSLLFANIEPGATYLYNHLIRVDIDSANPKSERCDPGYTWAYTSSSISLLVPARGKGLYKKTDARIEPVTGFEDIDIEGATVFQGSKIFAWTNCGELYCENDGKATRFSDELSEHLGKSRIFDVVELKNGNLGLTSTAGYHECLPTGKVINVVNQLDGLQKDFVYRLTEDNSHLWMSCGRSLAKITPSATTKRYLISDGSSKVHDFVFDGNHFLFCTDYGCDYLDLTDSLNPSAKPIQGLRNSAHYSVEKSDWGPTIIASTSGLFELKNKQASLVVDGRYYSLLTLDNGITLTSNQAGTILLIDRTDDDVRVTTGPVYPFEVRYLYGLEDGHVLVAGWNGDWSLMHYDKKSKKMTAIFHKLETKLVHTVSLLDQTAFLFDTGVYRIDVENGTAVLNELALHRNLKKFLRQNDVQNLLQVDTERFFVTRGNTFQLIDVASPQIKTVATWFLKGIGHHLATFCPPMNDVYCINHDELMVIDLDRVVDQAPVIPTPIIKSSSQTQWLAGAPTDDSQLQLKPRGEIQFSFSVPSCDIPPEELKYQYRLKGYNDTWSTWSRQRRKEYTNLPGGNFQFEVRSNVGEQLVSETRTLRFSVATPWYATRWARFGFVILGLSLVGSLMSYRSKQLAKSHQKMEQLVKLRTRELEVQKERVREKSEQLVQRTRLDETERLESLSRSLGCIAHDFNNLLFVVSANCELLELNLQPSQLKTVEGIKSAGTAAAGLCSQIQAFSGTLPVAQEKVFLHEEIQKATDYLEPAAGTNVKIHFDANPGNHPVFIDPVGLQQILLNLTVNASESGAQNIFIRTGESFFNESDLGFARTLDLDACPGQYQWIDVMDDGSGISAENLNQIFDPFFSTKRLGRGLGLSIVIRIVNSNLGLLFVESKPADDVTSGTKFRVCFPSHQQKTAAAIGTSSSDYAPQALSILLVDDDASIVSSISGCFRGLGHHVSSANTGAEALKILQSNELPDVALIDVSMPEMRGDRLAAEIDARGFDFPIYLMSGFSSDAIEPTVLNDERIEFIRKPFNINKLIHEIQARKSSVPGQRSASDHTLRPSDQLISAVDRNSGATR